MEYGYTKNDFKVSTIKSILLFRQHERNKIIALQTQLMTINELSKNRDIYIEYETNKMCHIPIYTK